MEEENLDLRSGDWHIGGPGAFGSNQYFSGEIDDLRIYDVDLSSEEIFNIYNGGFGDLGIMGKVESPIVSSTGTVDLSLSFSLLGKEVDVQLSENNISVSNGSLQITGAFKKMAQSILSGNFIAGQKSGDLYPCRFLRWDRNSRSPSLFPGHARHSQ